jgi:hypothetical protein
MALIAVEELLDANPWHGLRFGTLEPVEAGAIRRYPVAGSLYDVESSAAGLTVTKDGRLLFQSDAPVELRHVTFGAGAVNFEVRALRATKLRVGKQQLTIQPGTRRVDGAAV